MICAMRPCLKEEARFVLRDLVQLNSRTWVVVAGALSRDDG
jgi:hypothetical protein